jgi:nucleotide-binding universal stress UspA family protein
MELKILVPVDDSPTAHATIDAVIALKNRFPKKITLLYVINKEQLAYRMIPDFQVEMVKENAQKAGKILLDKYLVKLTEEGFEPETILKTGSPREMIADIANEDGFNLLVIGRHEGGGEIRDVLFGSVANFVLHNVKCPVLLF